MVLCYIHEIIQSYILGAGTVGLHETIHSCILGAGTWSSVTYMRPYIVTYWGWNMVICYIYETIYIVTYWGLEHGPLLHT